MAERCSITHLAFLKGLWNPEVVSRGVAVAAGGAP
jgi:hypothetical protein